MPVQTLIIDDSRVMRNIVRKALEPQGFTDFLEAGDGQEALETLDANPSVGLVLCDWNMPNMTGIEFVRAMRANAAWNNIPVVMVTTEAEKSRVIEAIQAGANNYVAKPFTPEALLQKVNACLGDSA